jgi:streptomycin 6-kinase
MDLVGTTVLLLERCEPGTPLSDVTEADQDGVVAGLLHRLWIQPPPGHGFRPLAQMCQQWAGQSEQEAAGRSCIYRPGPGSYGHHIVPRAACQRRPRGVVVHRFAGR